MIQLLGTSHISPQSVGKIREEIGKFPGCVAVELDPARYESLKYGEGGGYPSLLFRLLAWIQKRLGRKTGVLPGEEMLTGVESATNNGIDVYLIDQPIDETVRDFQEIGFLEKAKLFLTSLTFRPSVDFDLDEVPSYDLVEKSLKHIEEHAPRIYSILVEKRNRHMVKAIEELERRYDTVLVVVGIGHLPGLKELLNRRNISFEDKTF